MRPTRAKKAKLLSYADYLSMNDNRRCEIIDGVLYDMTPAPTPDHQRILTNLLRKFGDFLDQKPCEVFPAPFDVVLDVEKAKNERMHNIVQPDISIVCDPDKINEKGCFGPPDLVVEIISPSTASKDHIKKRALYEKFGVKEYWLVHPIDRIVTIYRIGKNGAYQSPEILDETGCARPGIFTDFEIALAEVFPPAPVVEDPTANYIRW